MAKSKKNNKLKRKRGKKFVYHGNGDDENANHIDQKPNPFEEHSKSKRAKNDLDKRKGLIDEFRRIGKNSQIVDNRIAQTSCKLSEEEKMKLRYIREQHD